MSRPLTQKAYLSANGARDFLQTDPAGTYQFVTTNNFTPNLGQWTPFGNVGAITRASNSFLLSAQNNDVSLQLSFLSPRCFRIRFNPAANASYDTDNSYAVINRDLGPVTLNILQNTQDLLLIDTGALQLRINLQPYALQVFRDNGSGPQLVHSDTTDDNQYYNLVYLPGHEVIANFKQTPVNAYYFGFGEKAGAQLAKNGFSLTQFNFDNFEYLSDTLAQGEQSGPLNPSEPLYCSVPLLIENNPCPQGVNAGPAYSYGLFFDNPSQSYFNIGANDYSDMDGMYYFGALYGELDYYFMLGDQTSEVVDQYTQLTGRPALAPRYALGYHQGCYGYYDQEKLSAAADAYRNASIPIDGLHIDIDLQNNYRTFTSSTIKFPGLGVLFSNLKANGFKCSTNITAMISNNPLDETGEEAPYPTRDEGVAQGYFLRNVRAGLPTDGSLFVGEENYGVNYGSNPYSYPPLQANGNHETQLGSGGYYPDLGRPEVRTWWGQQYQYLLSAGLEMVWQDMTDPAIYAYYDTPQMQQSANDTADSNPAYGEAPPPNENRVLSPWKTAPLDLMVTSFGESVAHAQVHNAFALLLSEATYNGLNQLRPQQRNFIIARGGYAGVQRYAALWTGDSASSWDFLQINLPQVLNLGLSGIPLSGCDIGGFGPGDGSVGEGLITNYELFTRWMQLGSFLPWYRNHYDGYVKQFQEPFNYAEPVPSNCRKYVELRYRMLQIYYDALYQSTQTGMPIARALFLNETQDPRIYDYLNDQFFVGRDILVAPIITPHETASPPSPPVRDIYLPAGSQWYAFMDDDFPLEAPIDGGTLVMGYHADLDQVPIYIRAGAILPMRQLEQWVGQLEVNPLTFNIYPGQDSTYTLYLDDGSSTQYATAQAYRLSEISHTGIANGQNIRIQRTHDHYLPAEPFYFVSLLGAEAPQSVSLDGKSLDNVESPQALEQSSVNAYYYNSTIKQVYTKIFDTRADTTLQLLFP
ncbi:TIM-barrel domain-containing protein [Pseudomonas sp. MWU13-2100]|uniref:TIM-barrel domain-containing protein n=1 Tax=Pseudomonas sp. MWU13-2100 TaxID=2935075 RepID=UPI00200E3DA3|nr:TIM-barrel domain-containing protein [Pseudomonas sp. MWU13-2100]